MVFRLVDAGSGKVLATFVVANKHCYATTTPKRECRPWPGLQSFKLEQA